MKKSHIILIGLLFVLSGVTSLVYESLWIRVLSLGVGSTSDSISMVLAIFFFGLSVGSYLAGKYSHKIKNPLLTYGVIEGLIGIYSLLIMFVLINFHHILSLLPLTGSMSWLGTFLKFFLVFLFLILPSMGMGATLPLLVQFFSTLQTATHKGKLLSILYAVNTLGAVLGAAAAGFFVIPVFGVVWGNIIMVVLNLFIFIVAKKITDSKNIIPVAITTKVPETTSLKSLSASDWAVMIACGICGFSSIAAEVVWSKYLGIFMGTNIFGLGLVLSLFLLGIALGSFVLSFFIERVKNLHRLFYILLFISGLLVMSASILFNVTPAVVNVLGYYAGSLVPLIVIKAIVSGLVLFIPTIIFGALLPLGITILSRGNRSMAGLTGTAYAINTVGSILGSCLAGLILIPWVGSSVTIQIAIVALFAAGILTILTSEAGKTRSLWTAAAVAIATLAVTSGSIEYRNIIKSAYYQTANSDMSINEALKYFSRDYEEFELIHEGKTAIISLSHDPQDGEHYRDYMRLKTNGLNESVYNLKNLTELPKYEALLGYLPYAVSKNPESAFIVGYGGGYTVDYLTSTGIKDVYVVELEKGIIEAANAVYKGDNPITKRPNLKLSIEDARFVLAAKLYGPYDIIVSQPSHSWLSGVANLFTKEFFQIVKGNLKPAGVFSQWLNLYNMDETVLKSILKTFFDVFPHGAVFTNYEDEELIMLGSTEYVEIDYTKLIKMTANTDLQKRLSQIPFKSPADVLSNFLASRETILKWVGDAKTNTDLNAYAEVQQSLLFYSKNVEQKGPQSFLSRIYDANFGELIPTARVSKDLYFDLLQSHQTLGKFDKFHVAMKRYETLIPEFEGKSLRLGNLCVQAQRYACAEENLKKAFAEKPNTASLNALVGAYMQVGNWAEMRKLLEQNRDKWNQASQCYALDAYLKLGARSEAANVAQKMTGKVNEYTQQCGEYFNKIFGMYYYDKGDLDVAVPFLEAFQTSYSQDMDVYSALLSSYLKRQDLPSAASYADAFRGAVEREQKRLRDLASFYESHGYKDDADALNKVANKLAL